MDRLEDGNGACEGSAERGSEPGVGVCQGAIDALCPGLQQIGESECQVSQGNDQVAAHCWLHQPGSHQQPRSKLEASRFTVACRIGFRRCACRA